MTYITKVLVLFAVLILHSCVINNPTAEDCIKKEIIITKIEEGTSNDIVLFDGKTDYYYINRGIEQGLDISVLREKLLNKKATLHLYKFLLGTSEHISQLEVDNEILYTELQAAEGYSEF